MPNNEPLIRTMATNRLLMVVKKGVDRDALMANANNILGQPEDRAFDLIPDPQPADIATYRKMADDSELKYTHKEVTPLEFILSDPKPGDLVEGKQEYDETPLELLTFGIKPNKQLGEHDILQAVLRLDEGFNVRHGGDIIAVAPNWLTVTCPPDVTSGGGPGARPVTSGDPNPPYMVKFFPRNNPAQLNDVLKAKASKQEVVIAILDTSPTKADFAAKVASTPDNALLQELSDKNVFEIHADDAVITTELNGISGPNLVYPVGHDYVMNSHGVFVAGLIHSIIPYAKIHLIRVLNDYAVGTTMSVKRGLELAKQLGAGKLLVINMSLTMVFPYPEMFEREELADWATDWQDLKGEVLAEKDETEQRLAAEANAETTRQAEEKATGKKVARPKKDRLKRTPTPKTLLKSLRIIMELAMSTTADPNTLLVAAAGNSGRPGKPQPLTQYPAAFDNVIGVGALKRLPQGKDPNKVTEVQFTSYSCSVDKPAVEGFAVMGGDTDPGDVSYSNSNFGMVGLWIDDRVPPGRGLTTPTTANNGWVRWSGTSFATPLISGALAAIMAQGNTPDQAVTMLNDSWTEVTDPPARIGVPQVVLARQE